MELHSGSSAKNAIKGRPDSHQEWAPNVYLKVIHSELKTQFFSQERSEMDGDFPRASHKSLLSHSVSERVHLHVLREE